MTAPPPLVDSRVWNGTLTFTPTTPGTPEDFSCQVTNVTVTGEYDNDGDPVSTLCGETHPAPRKSNGYHLTGTFIQDFDSPTGIWQFTFDHELEPVPFSFKPNDSSPGMTITGTAIIEMGDLGGDMRTRNTSDFDFVLSAKPTIARALAEVA
jgi:hypothetical protein